MSWLPTDEEVSYYKSLNQDKSVANGDYYKVMLPILLDYVNEEYSQSFMSDSLPGNVKLFLAKATQFMSGSGTGMKSRRMGTVSYSFDFDTLPTSITGLLSRYRKVRFRAFKSV